MRGFLVAGGSVPGYEHTKPGQPGWSNNQDAFAWHATDDLIVAVVCDGCSTTPHAEVGAKLGVQLVMSKMAGAIADQATAHWPLMRRVEEAMWSIRESVSYELSLIAKRISEPLGQSYEQCMHDYFLFTVMGAVITPEKTIVFSLGDGVYAVNGEVSAVAQYEGNEPPYLAYAQMPSVIYPRKSLELQVRAALPTSQLRSLLIGSDGVADLIKAAQKPLPGKDEPVGDISLFWMDDKFVQNPDAIRRRLALVNREHADGGQIKKGLLPDDTTILVIRQNTQKGA